MPWRMRFLTTRNHPLAYAAYAATALLGLTLITGWTDTVSLHGFDRWVAILWKAQLLTGGLAGLWAIIEKPKMTPHWPDLGDLLRVEAIASGQAAMGFFVYTYNVINVLNRVSVPAIVLCVMGLGLAARCYQAYRESSQAERLAVLYDEVRSTMESLDTFAHAPVIQRLSDEEVEITTSVDHDEQHGNGPGA